MDTVLAFLAPVIGFFGLHYGAVGVVIGYVLMLGVPVISILIELLEFAVSLTVSKADDEFAAKVQAIWDKVLPWLEMLPHANLPISAGMTKFLAIAMKVAGAIKGAITGWLGSKGA